MKNISLLKTMVCCLAVSLLLTAIARAQPSRDTILGDLKIMSKKDHSIIQIGFTFPIRYIRHYPLKSGDEVRIQIRPIVINPNDADDLFQRESIPPEDGNSAKVTDVVYEGSDGDGRYLTLYFEESVTFKVGQGNDYRSLEVLVYPKETPALPALPVKPDSAFYAINLASAVIPFDPVSLSSVKAPAEQTLYTTRFEKNGQLWNRLRLGFFSNPEDAKREITKYIKAFPGAWVTKVSEQERKLAVSQKPLPTSKVLPSSQGPKVPIIPGLQRPDSLDLMAEADLAMANKNYGRAIQLYTKLAKAKDIVIGEQAQQKLGIAREENGQMAHAKAEYRRYLALYPQGAGTEEVSKRLDKILKGGRPGSRSAASESRWRQDLYGSFSQFYFFNESNTDANGSVVTQSLLKSDLNFNLRIRSDNVDIQNVFIGGYEADFQDNDDSRSRVSSGYVNLQHKITRHSARIGRQTYSSGGVLGRFDGALIGAQLSDKLRLNLIGGYPVQSSSSGIETDPYFYGISIDLGTLADRWDFNTFFINQETEGITDRQAIGGEVRYFNPHGSFFSLVDYDIFYNELNTFLLVGTYTLATGTIINFSTDYRQTPSLTTGNALIGQIDISLEQLIDTIGEDAVQDLARDRTAVFRSATIGITQPINQKLQVAADISWFDLEGTKASGGIEEIRGTGDEFFYSLQLLGKSLIKKGDLAILGVRYGDTATSDIFTINLNTRYPISHAWRINPRLLADFRQNRENNSDQFKIRPSLRTDYRWSKSLHFELETGMEWSSTRTPGQEDDDTRGFFLIAGYRFRF